MTLASESDKPSTKADGAEICTLADFIEKSGLEPMPLPQEYFYASLPLCVIDAVFSIGVAYTSTQNTVARFCERQGWSVGPVDERANGEKTLSDLLACCSGLSSDVRPGQDSLRSRRGDNPGSSKR